MTDDKYVLIPAKREVTLKNGLKVSCYTKKEAEELIESLLTALTTDKVGFYVKKSD